MVMFNVQNFSMMIIVRKILGFVKRHLKLLVSLLALAVILPLLVIVTASLIIRPYSKYVLSSPLDQHFDVGVVLGAGVDNNGKPYKELQARLDSAADAVQSGQVDKLLVSGDNRFVNYNEPQAMMNYLIENRGIPADKVFPDYAGRSTYESCERATKIFGITKTVIFSAGSHLPRAIFLCRHFGIEAYGEPNNVEANNATRREILARVKALYNVWIRGERTVLGSPIPLN